MIKHQIDTLIEAKWIATVDDNDSFLENHTIAIQEGIITDILPSVQAQSTYQAQEYIRLGDYLLTPGFVNAHTHAAMSLLRGLADDLPLMDWLHKHIWPAEQQWVTCDFVADGSRLAIAEMIKTGTTCFNDMYYFADTTATVAEEAGIRATLGLIVLEFPSPWAAIPDEYINKGLKLHDELKSKPLINTAFAPHAPYTVSDRSLERVRSFSDELEVPIHIHLHETAQEIEESIKQHGLRPIQRLQQLGLLGPHLLAVHMTQLTNEDVALVDKWNLNIIHCPKSNMKLASDACPVDHLLSKEINVSIGTDGAASNNSLDMLSEMRTASLLAKHQSTSASALNLNQSLRCATINGAKALGLDSIIGSIEHGKSADLIAIDLNRINSQPVYNPISQLVYCASSDQVTDVWVDGKQLLKNGHLTTLDEQSILGKAKEWQSKIHGQ